MTKESVSLVLIDKSGEFLVVKRPQSDNDKLSGLWGFPAASLKPEETAIQAVERIALSKLGVQVTKIKKLGESLHNRNTYTLHMVDYEGSVIEGEPLVPQPDKSVTQYTNCKFTDDYTILFDAARRGSQCTQIFLRLHGVDWQL